MGDDSGSDAVNAGWPRSEVCQANSQSDTSSAKDFFTASAGKPVKASNEFKAFETKLLLKLLDFFLAFGVVILGQNDV